MLALSRVHMSGARSLQRHMAMTVEYKSKALKVVEADALVTIETLIAENSDDKVVLVDFHADWCAPCKSLYEVMKGVLEAGEEETLLVKVDVDDCADIATEFEITSIPYVVGYKNQEKRGSFMGAKTEAQFRSFLEEITKVD